MFSTERTLICAQRKLVDRQRCIEFEFKVFAMTTACIVGHRICLAEQGLRMSWYRRETHYLVPCLLGNIIDRPKADAVQSRLIACEDRHVVQFREGHVLRAKAFRE